MNEKESLITIEDLSIGYEKNVIIKDLSLKVQEGDYIAVIGENGTGKTTLIQTLLGFIPAVSGIVKVEKEASRIGYVPQFGTLQRDFPASVEEIVYTGFLGKRKRLFYSKKEKKIALRNMERIGILNLAKSCYRELSGGQQQRVLLARALCAADQILVLDEPDNGLDENATNLMYDILRMINKEYGLTILIVSHDLERMKEEAGYFLVLHENESYDYIPNDKRGEIVVDD